MFKVCEEMETYEGGFENNKSSEIEFETYKEAAEYYKNRVAAHVKAGHHEVFKMDKAACFAEFEGRYAKASYKIMIV